MYDRIIKSDIETNTYLHSNFSHKRVVCIKVCIRFQCLAFLRSEIYKVELIWLKVYYLTAKSIRGVRMQIFNSE